MEKKRLFMLWTSIIRERCKHGQNMHMKWTFCVDKAVK